MKSGAIYDPLRLPLEQLALSEPVLAHAARLGATTVAEATLLPLTVRTAWAATESTGEAELSTAVRTVITRCSTSGAVRETDLCQPLEDLDLGPRARRACDQLGLSTLAQLLSTPSDQLLAVHGCGPQTVRDLERFLTDLLETEPPAVSEEPAQAPLKAVPACSFQSVVERALRSVDSEDRRLLSAWLGIDRRPSSLRSLAAEFRIPADDLAARLVELGPRFEHAVGSGFEALLQATERDLACRDGVLRPAEATRSDALGSAIRAAGRRPDLPLRVAALCRPERFSFDRGALLDAPRPRVRSWLRALRRALRRRDLPCSRETLRLDATSSEPASGVTLTDAQLDHLFSEHLDVAVQFDASGEERLVPRRVDPAGRLEAILEDVGKPLAVDDLLFHYRDRHRSARRTRLHEVLRGDRRFLQVDRMRFDLRRRHVDELELTRPYAEQLCERIVATGERTAIGTARGDAPTSERTMWLAIDLLRSARRVRYLGRGEFCPRRIGCSPLVDQLEKDLRRAMGEVPFARFLQNQDPRRRPLISRLLRENRRFVFPTNDRVDLLENYPFNRERLRLLLRETTATLEAAGGHAPLARVQAAVLAAELGGAFLTEALLLDLLRRHGDYEILPGAHLALPDTGLGSWIQRSARDVLRAAERALTTKQLLAACPELAEFDRAIEPMLNLDPLVHSADGLHYEIA